MKWIERYKESTEIVGRTVDVLTAFNANIDVSNGIENLNLDLSDVDPVLKEQVDSIEDLKSSIKFCKQNSENHEIELGDVDLGIDGEETIGGQAGIMANYLSATGNGVIFYTPLLSEELAQNINEKVLYPVIEKKFVLKNVRDAANTDRTKKNYIFEFKTDKTGRLILSGRLKGFGPYFRKGVEDNLGRIEENIDCGIFSGFHNVEGNKEAKVVKSASQLRKMDKPTHLEYVHKDDETAALMAKHIMPEVNSLGLDETEFKELNRLLRIENLDGDVSLGKAFENGKKIIERFDLDRLHLHTFRYHLAILPEDYPRSKEKVRESMLFGELSAVQMAEKGEMPDKEDIRNFNMENKKLGTLKELEEFGDFFNLERFAETGLGEVEGYNVVAIPIIIHEDPVRTVGMGDLISCGAFTSEFSEN